MDISSYSRRRQLYQIYLQNPLQSTSIYPFMLHFWMQRMWFINWDRYLYKQNIMQQLLRLTRAIKLYPIRH